MEQNVPDVAVMCNLNYCGRLEGFEEMVLNMCASSLGPYVPDSPNWGRKHLKYHKYQKL